MNTKHKTFLITFALLIAAALVAFKTSNLSVSDYELTLKWETPRVMRTPESVCYDTLRNVIYVANINGKPTEKDENGFISKIAPDGTIILIEWIRGLNAPKGMGIYNNILYVADIDRIAKIDINKNALIEYFVAEDAKFLNDIAIDKATGEVYVSDYTDNKIYKLKDNNIELWIKSEKLIRPNGLFIENGKLLVGTQNAIISIGLKDKNITNLIAETGSIDGLDVVGNGIYIFSDWSGAVHIAEIGKEKINILDTSADNINAADIDYVPTMKMLIIPTFNDNRIRAYNLK